MFRIADILVILFFLVISIVLIFKPYGYEKTLAQMTDEERTNRTKYKSIDSMKEFAKWYKNK